MQFGNCIIISPNADYVPQFPFIDDGKVVVREDGHFGGQSPHRWPQPFSRKYIHHCFIPFDLDWHICNTALRKRDDINNIKIYDPDDKTDFVPDPQAYDSDSGTPIGSLRSELIDTLQQAFFAIASKCEDVGRTLRDRGQDGEAYLVYKRCARTCTTVLNRLRSLKLSWRAVLSSVRDIQCGIMELHGLNTYLRDIVLRKQITKKQVYRTRGAFTMDFKIAEKLQELDIPVWFICDARAFLGRVLDVQDCVPWSRYLSKDYVTYEGKAVLRGFDCNRSGSLRNHLSSHFMSEQAIELLLDEIHAFENFTPEFSVLNIQALESPASSHSVSGSSQARSPQQHTPKAVSRVLSGTKSDINCGATSKTKRKPTKNEPKNEPYPNYARLLHIPVTINKEPDLPKHHPVVLECLKSIVPIEPDYSLPARYPYPPPYLLVHRDSDYSARLYLNYIRIRDALIKRQEEPGTLDKRNWLKAQEWKVYLRGEYHQSTPLPSGSASQFVEGIYSALPLQASTGPKRKKKTSHRYNPRDLPPSKRRRLVGTATAKSMMVAEYDMGSLDLDARYWWRNRFVSKDDIIKQKSIREEVQYEITENSMRAEVRALDFLIHPRDSMSDEEQQNRDKMISCIFHRDGSPAASKYAGIIVDLSGRIEEYWDQEVSEGNMQALFRLLSTWPNFPHHGTLLDFKTLISFYIRTFVQYFNRVPNMHCSVPDSLVNY
ncbi:uncharacterized protein FOMMEDRAFT_149647 [Fomitiporia mediterranea MF3/22]|uniref:Uncharacterized protein n=1 Tax=Fomitiporia mediterranea (strain MF3/22) TaxID=694068 RepID=R7SGN7_FOMME|nr:uncharacterized protein FOMMEDRAFT_149647 [Fomitiporia mediterranea MF3/22]EJC97585.1 hypothetical protein FOMMEDRAFT_149647 [Fomitiporia mediterranea MF3/22]